MRSTPSAVSQQMSALARDTGVVLLERTPKGMRLTQFAEALVAHAEAVFARLGRRWWLDVAQIRALLASAKQEATVSDRAD